MVKRGMSEQDYNDADGIRSSALKYVAKSPAHYKAYIDGAYDKKDTSAFDLGKAVHASFLEQRRNFVSLSEGCKLNTKAGKEEKAELQEKHPDKLILKHDDFIVLNGMYESFLQEAEARRILCSGDKEVSFFAQDERDLSYKARTDLFEAGSFIVDLKTTRREGESGVRRDITDYDYYLSAAHYIDVVERATGERIDDFIWVFFEKSAPYCCHIKYADKDLLNLFSEYRNTLLDQIASCRDSGKWPKPVVELGTAEVMDYRIHQIQEAISNG